MPLLYWSAASLGAAISLGGIDHPELLIDWPVVRALGERALALDETWGNGAIHELMMTVESQGDALGGSEERARQHFARAVEIQKGLSPGPYVGLALGLVKSKQDREEFEELLERALAIDPAKDPSNRLVTLITQKRARLFLRSHRRPVSGGLTCPARPCLGPTRWLAWRWRRSVPLVGARRR